MERHTQELPTTMRTQPLALLDTSDEALGALLTEAFAAGDRDLAVAPDALPRLNARLDAGGAATGIWLRRVRVGAVAALAVVLLSLFGPLNPPASALAAGIHGATQAVVTTIKIRLVGNNDIVTLTDTDATAAPTTRATPTATATGTATAAVFTLTTAQETPVATGRSDCGVGNDENNGGNDDHDKAFPCATATGTGQTARTATGTVAGTVVVLASGVSDCGRGNDEDNRGNDRHDKNLPCSTATPTGAANSMAATATEEPDKSGAPGNGKGNGQDKGNGAGAAGSQGNGQRTGNAAAFRSGLPSAPGNSNTEGTGSGNSGGNGNSGHPPGAPVQTGNGQGRTSAPAPQHGPPSNTGGGNGGGGNGNAGGNGGGKGKKP